jgi:hypothetical protein
VSVISYGGYFFKDHGSAVYDINTGMIMLLTCSFVGYQKVDMRLLSALYFNGASHFV